jgi:hypothetical protein
MASRPPYRLLHITDISDLPPYNSANPDERWHPFDFPSTHTVDHARASTCCLSREDETTWFRQETSIRNVHGMLEEQLQDLVHKCVLR